MDLVLGLKPLQDIIAAPLVPEYLPHSLGQVYIILELYLLVNLVLRHLMNVVGLSKFLLL